MAAGEWLLAPTVTRRLIAEFVRRPEPSSGPGDDADAARGLASPTDPEREVLVAVAAGRSNAELAADLHMSPATAKTHVGRVLAKLGTRDRAQLLVAAYEYGVVTPHGTP